MNDSKRARHLFEIAKATRTLISCTIELTQKCIFRCPHCFVQGIGYDSLNYDDFVSFVDQFCTLGGVFVTLTGGEVLVHPQFVKMYEYAYKRGLAVTVFTNGYLIDDDIIEIFAKLPPRKIEISIYGASEKTYYEVSKIRGCYGKVIENVDRLLHGKQNVQLKTVLMQQNYQDFEMIKKLAQQRNVPFKYDFKLMPKRNGDDSNLKCQITPTQAITIEIADNKEKVCKWKSDMDRHDKKTSEYMFDCGAARYSCFLSSENRLRICASAVFSEIDMNKFSLCDAWERFSKYTAQRTNCDSKCHKCELSLLCDICPIWGYVMDNDVDSLGKEVDIQCLLAEERKKVALGGKNESSKV